MKLGKTIAIATALAGTLAAMIGLAAPASAHCPATFVCGYRDVGSGYTGPHFHDLDNVNYYSTVAFEDANGNDLPGSADRQASALQNFFTRCKARFYEGFAGFGGFITLNNYLQGGVWRDDNLISFPGQSSSWNDRIRSHRAVFCG